MPRAVHDPKSDGVTSAQPTRARKVGAARGRANESEQLSDTIATIYDAAIDRERWVDAVAKATQFIGCFAGALAAVDFLHGGPNLAVQWGYPPATWQRYLDEFYHQNPLNAPAYRTSVGEVRQASTFDGYEEFLRSDFYSAFCQPLGIIDGIQSTIDKSGSNIALMTCVRHADAGPVDPDDLRRARLILPHLRRAFLIARLLDLHKVRAEAFAEAMDGLSTGVFFVNPAGQLVHTNPAGKAMIDARDPVTLSAGQLVTSEHAMMEAVRQAFASALDDTIIVDTPRVSVTFAGRNGRHFTAHVLPLNSGIRKAVTSAATAVLFVREATVDVPAAIGAAGQLYGFTPAESRVLTALVEVGSAAALPGMLGVAKRTVQTHLEHLFDKTGTKRQAELVRLIAGYDPPIRRNA